MITYIVGIDPGFTCTGIAILKATKSKIILIDYATVIENGSMKSCQEWHRASMMAAKILDKILKMLAQLKAIRNPNILPKIAIEYIFYDFRKRNPAALIIQSRLLQAIGDVFDFGFSELDMNIDIVEYNPNTVKAAICRGKATKAEARQAAIEKISISAPVKNILSDLSIAKYEAIYDAMAVAYTHIVKGASA